MRPVVSLPTKYEFIALQRQMCSGCDRDILSMGYGNHLSKSPACIDGWWDAFYKDIMMRWDELDITLLESLALWRGTRYGGREKNVCCCGTGYKSRLKLNNHIRSVAGDDCFKVLWDEFVLWMREFYGGSDD